MFMCEECNYIWKEKQRYIGDPETTHCPECGSAEIEETKSQMENVGLCNLELITYYDGGVYWFLDYRFKEDSGKVFLNSQIYKDDKSAIFALISGMIKWTECHTEK